MLSNYQFEIVEFYNIPIGNIKKMVPNFFDKKAFPSLWRLTTLFKARIKSKNNASYIRIQSMTIGKKIY